MAYVLSLGQSSPLIMPLRQHTPNQSCPSRTSRSSTRTVQHNRLRSISTSSLNSLGSCLLPSSRKRDEHRTTRSASSFNLPVSGRLQSLGHVSTSPADSTRTSFASTVGNLSRSVSAADVLREELKVVDIVEHAEGHSSDVESSVDPKDDSNLDNPYLQATVELDVTGEQTDDLCSNVSSESTPQQAFRRWISKLRKRKHCRPVTLTPRQDRFVLDDFDKPPASSPGQKRSGHRKSDSQNSSLGFVTAVKSATATLASASIANVSRRTSKWRRGQQRSSLVSGSDPRPSVDSQRSIMDEAAKQRSRKRREKLEELIRSEEGYVADVKALSDAYFTLLGHHPTSASFVRASAQRTIAEILRLHDDILGQLHRAVPFAEYDQSIAKAQEPRILRTHGRWHSIDTVPTVNQKSPIRGVLASQRHRRSLNINRSSDDEPMVLRCSPQTVANVAQDFISLLPRFSVYEEYGANYEMIQRDIEETQRSIATWPDFDKAIEMLAVHVNSTNSWKANHKKATTVKDLLIKPIQRLPRYELLFNDLLRFTPVCDDPVSHSLIDGLRSQLNETCQRTNQAKENPTRTRMIETTWLIGERLTFSSQIPKSVFLQLLGQVTLCGCLHIAYRTRDRIKGRYVACILFETTLLLASIEDELLKYSAAAGIALANATVVEADNLKGLQCHTAPHTWKIIYEHSARMYELLLTACSAVEADVWREHVGRGIEQQSQAVANGAANVFELQSPLTAEMRSIGKAFGKPGSFVRRMSVQRAATVGPTSEFSQVIIKNTQAVKDAQETSSQTSLRIPRSQSVATPSHVQTLAPRRAERLRLETLLCDVWTKDLLPYPGMVRRSDPLRASANHVIRKFSMASITSNFSSSKRTASYTGIASSRKEDVQPLRPKCSLADSLNRQTKPARPLLVNFHTTPNAFLPADFELEDPTVKRRKLGLRTLTMTMERPFSPLLSSSENRQSGLRRAQSVRDTTSETASSMQSSSVPPVPALDTQQAGASIYSIRKNRARTPVQSQLTDESVSHEGHISKTPRKAKSKNRLLRFFG